MYSTIYAVNGAGMTSAPVKSNGLIIDTTPPVPGSYIRYEDNIIVNSEFDEDINTGWTADEVMVYTDDNTGETYARLDAPDVSSLSQNVTTTVDTKYRLILTTRAHVTGTSSTVSFLAIDVKDNHQVIGVIQPPDQTSKWTSQYIYFNAETTETSVVVTLHGNQASFGKTLAAKLNNIR